jgi:hypothetical protein
MSTWTLSQPALDKSMPPTSTNMRTSSMVVFVDGASAENEEEPAAMKARILTKVSKDVPLIEQERETQKLVD